ncbi:MAG: phage Gp37/Gp68 family protein, partial [Ignavibacteria bacterium]|nr:phage Gp37/Gp68 family protein [Ignavibacteria bacterium]
SPGCKFCYAERMAKRLKAMGSENYKNGFKLTMQEHALTLPLTWKKPQTIFVNSMSDLFHKDIPVSFVKKTFDVMNKADWHRFQVLTKRSDTLLKLNSELNWTKNIWMGVSVENQDYTFRVDDLRQTNAHIKFLSIEPLIGRINDLDLTNIDWVIVGGESGPGARPIEEEWVVRIKDICKEAKVPFFFKQWGGVNKKKNGRTLKGKIWSEMPKLKRAA